MAYCVDCSIKKKKALKQKLSANIRRGPIRSPMSFYCLFSHVIAEKKLIDGLLFLLFT